MIEDDSEAENETSEDVKEAKTGDEVIGHMQSKDGETLGDLVVVNKNIVKSKFKHKTQTGK